MPIKNAPFAPYINAPAPEILRAITPPGDEPAAPGVTIERVVFRSLTVPTPEGPRTNEVYTVIARPEAPGTYPGLLLLHGGGGQADTALAAMWARHGYIVVAPELPGIGEPTKVPHSAGFWKEHPYGYGRWNPGEDWNANTIFQAVTAALQALSLLKSQPDVDVSRIGVTGISWGGYTTTMVAGLAGDGIRAAFSLYGSGHYENCVFNGKLQDEAPEAREKWLRTLDAAVYSGNIKASYFVAAAANDAFFYPPAVRDTLNAITAPKNWVLAPNADHVMPIPGGEVPGDVSPLQSTFFAWELKDEGAPLPRVELLEIPATAPDKVRFAVTGAQGEFQAELYYSLPDGHWTERKWLAVPAVPVDGNIFEAELPVVADACILVSDSRPVSVSSELFAV